MPQQNTANLMKRAPVVFLPPEMLGSLNQDFSKSDEIVDQLSGMSAWDVAIRYHELKTKKALKERAPGLRALSIQAVLEKARSVMGSINHPVQHRQSLWNEIPANAIDPEIDIEETVEAGTQGSHEIWLNYRVQRSRSIVIALDTSLSMTGDKLALTAVALAVVLLQFPDDPVGLIAFENDAVILKYPDEKSSVEALIGKFLDVPCQGYTHLEAGIKAALKMSLGMRGRSGLAPRVVLLTDGKYTAGRDPSYLAPRFDHWVVVKMGRDQAGRALCKELARKGHGQLKEVSELEQLPVAMYSIVKGLLRGFG